MDRFFQFFVDNAAGIAMFLVAMFALVFLVRWVAWIFGWGRFAAAGARPPGQNLAYVFSQALVAIIDDFRHLLALVIVLIFAAAMMYVLYKAEVAGGSMDNIKDALQVVMATLGGLVGSIIGYYFGESAVRRSGEPAPSISPPAAPRAEVQAPPPAGGPPAPAAAAPIQPAPPPRMPGAPAARGDAAGGS